MDEKEKLQQQMAEIGTRYLTRTLGELSRLHELLDELRGGATHCIKDIEHMTHKIHGSGAMFGFDAVSDCAHEVELLAGSSVVGTDLLQRLEVGITLLEEQVMAAARARGLQ